MPGEKSARGAQSEGAKAGKAAKKRTAGESAKAGEAKKRTAGEGGQRARRKPAVQAPKTTESDTYDATFCAALLDWFRVPPCTEKLERTFYADGTLKSEKPSLTATPLPTFEGFADSLGVEKKMLETWGAQHVEFGRALAMARQMQEHIWLVNAMNGLYNSTFAQFFGKNRLGYGEKDEPGDAASYEEALRTVEGEEF